jgi:hypothetical protein
MKAARVIPMLALLASLPFLALLARAAEAQTPPREPQAPLSATPASRVMPAIRFLYPAPDGSVFDRVAPTFLKETPDTAWVHEAARRLPEFQAAWDREGRAYLDAALQLVRLDFPYREMQATLTVSSVYSMSDPLLINVRPFLASTQATGVTPVGLDHFCESVFHELMHHYTRPVFRVSALRRKYASDTEVVRDHLHVMALEVVVLTRLGKSEELAYLDRLYRDRKSSPPGYARAWQIVRDEGPEAFLSEFALAR